MHIWAVPYHLLALLWIPLAGLICLGILLYLPFFKIFGPLIIWLWKRSNSPWVDLQGRESLNFQLSLVIYSLIIIFISLLLVILPCVINLIVSHSDNHVDVDNVFAMLSSILFGLIFMIAILQAILVPFTALKAYVGKYYRYPLIIRFLSYRK